MKNLGLGIGTGALRLFFCVACAMIMINAFAYFLDALIKFPQADDYRLTILHLIPWYDGSWEFASLWGDVHPNPIHGLYLIFSAKFERLSFDSLPYIVFASMLLKWWGYCLAVNRAGQFDVDQKLAIAFLFAIIVFSFNSTMQYRWNSVGIAQIYHAIGAFYLVALVGFIQSATKMRVFLLLITMICFQIIARQYSMPWFVSTALVLSLACVGRDRQNVARCFSYIALLLSVLLFEKLFHSLLGISLSSGVDSKGVSALLHWFDRPFDLIKYLIVAIASPIVNPRLLKIDFGLSEAQVLTVSVIVCCLVLFCIFRCLRELSKPVYQLSLIMILFSFITIAAGILYRTHENTAWFEGHVSRYVSFRDVLTLGVLTVMYKQFVGLGVTILQRFTYSITLVCFLVLQYSYVAYNWNYLSSLEHYVAKNKAELVFIADYLERDSSASPSDIKLQYKELYGVDMVTNIGTTVGIENNGRFKVIFFWKINNLNLFE